MEIVGDIKNYDWGKLGSESEVSKLASLNDEKFVIDIEKPYSELWMGDHISGPSKVKESRESLTEFIQKDREGNIGGQDKLPFLFKVLSIGKALSIQVHPNKEEAEKLHAEFPDIYKDPNHKPEIAIALTPFLALCDFRPHTEIYHLLKSHDELVALLGADNIELINTHGSEGLKTCYSQLMKSNESSIKKCIDDLSVKFGKDDSKLAKVFMQLQKDFPYDVGSLSLFFLNLVELKPGQSIYLAAKIPHAYLDGDCIECMACSDNVVRAGLTPKFKDVEVLLNMLIYNGATAEAKLFQPTLLDSDHPHTWLFKPPIEDFAVLKTEIPSSVSDYELFNSKFGSIMIVISGNAQMNGLELKRGSVIFLPSKLGAKISLKNISNNFICYQAMFNDF